MNKITLFHLSWSCYNGFIFELLHIDSFKPCSIYSSLLGINCSKSFLIIDLFWNNITIFDLTE